jgi:heme/copper-type cytochrome/quinol oxidase subunit 1
MERPGGGSVVTGSAIGCGRRISLIGEFARTGRLPFPPLSELTYSPGAGVDYHLRSLEIFRSCFS